jgi:hypothetical protein
VDSIRADQRIAGGFDALARVAALEDRRDSLAARESSMPLAKKQTGLWIVPSDIERRCRR